MSTALWNVTSHVIQASHIRGFPRGIQDEAAGGLRLAVKKYVPKSNSCPEAGDITIIFAHGAGSSKESYEPFFDDLLSHGIRIRAVWAADAAHHGASYILNEDIIGDEPNWHDFARDITHMINYFQTQIPSPLVGMGQSWGNFPILSMAINHPRLFAGLVLIEPVVGPGFGEPQLLPLRDHWSVKSTRRRDRWPSRAAARESLRNTDYYGAYDSRTFDIMITHELRDLPTEPPSADPPVTLTTPRRMEAYTFMRPDPPLAGCPEGPDYATRAPDTVSVPGFYRAEGPPLHDALPSVHPATLFVWADASPIARSSVRGKYLRITGSGRGGNGGAASGQVQEAWVMGARHPAPLENPTGTALAIAPWLKTQMARWKKEREMKRLEPGYEKDFPSEFKARLAKL